MHKKCVEDVLDSEWVARRVLVHTQAEARQGLKTQVMKNYSALRIQLARSERRRRLMLHLMNVEIKEASDRPVIEEQMERELFIILDNIEAHWRQQVANEESEQRSKTRKESFSSWEKYYKKEKQRYLFERFERCNLEGEEGTARLVIKEEEFTDFSHVMEAADESWGDVERVLLARAQREEEERRRIAAKLAEEERERQWKKEKQQKEEERLQYERQRVRERMQKEERKIRQVFKKTEEAARGFLKEMIDQEYKITEVASHLQRVLHERYLELCKPPVITLAYEKLRGHAVVYFEECSNPVNLWFPDQKLQISLPGGWYERLEVLEKQAAKHAKSEIALRNDLDPKISTLVEQLKTVLKNNELPFTTCNRPNIHRTKEYIMKSVLFPAIDHVAAEKVRIWGGSVQCNVTRDPIALGPNSGIDVVTINDSEHDCAFERIKEATNMIEVGLDDMGGVTVEDLDALMKDFLYYSLGKGDAPYNRTVSFTIKLDVVSLLEVELETYRNDEGAVQCVPLEKPYQKDIIAAPFEWSCFLIVLHPYIQFAPGTFNVTSLKRVGQKVDVGASVYFSSSPRNSILVDSFPSLKDTYQFEYHEDACQASSLLPFDVTVSVPTSHTISQDLSAITVQHNIHSFENASLTISIVTGWTPNDLVMVSTTGAITYSTSSGMLILDNEPVATISREMKPVSSHPGMYTMAPVEVGNVHEVLCMQFVGNVGKLKMKSVLQNLFYCNNIIDPMVGVREMQLTITDAEGLFCVVPFNIEVKWTDVPTKLVVEETKLCFRTPCQPDIYEQHLAFIEHNTLPLMPDVRLVDPDTREFCGGYVVATLTAEGLTPTEGLLIDVSPNCKVGISVDTASKDEKDGTMNKDVFFNGNLFAHACFKTGQNSDEFTELTLDFVVDGGATVEIAQELLRSICYYNKALKTIPLAVRTVEISLLVGPSMLKKDVHGNVIEHEIVSKGKPITLSLQVRTTMPSIRVPQKHACMKYLEGSGVKRLGPFEVATDEDACTKDWGGFVKVEVVQGCEEGDVLLLKEDHGIRIIKLEDVTSEDKDEFPLDWKKRKSSIFNLDEFNESDDDQNEADQASDKSDDSHNDEGRTSRAMSLVLGTPIPPPSVGTETAPMTIKERLRQRIRGVAVANIQERRRGLQEAVSGFTDKMKQRKKGLDSRFRKGRSTKFDVIYEEGSHKHSVGTLYISPKGAVLLQLMRKIKRNHLLAALKCIAYTHDGNNPQEYMKKIRLTLACHNGTSTQCLVELQVQPVDDVTELCFKHDRLTYRQGTVGSQAIGAFRLAPLCSAWLNDPDTEHFDGGYLEVEMIAGGCKGDCIQMLTRDQQLRQYQLEQCDSKEVTKEIFAQNPILEVTDNTLVHDGTVIATITHTRSPANPCTTDFRLTFAKQPTPSDPPLVPLWLASYVLNCLTFANTDTDKTREGVRAYRISILDPGNATPGKIVIHIDVMGPILYAPGFAIETPGTAGAEVVVAPKINLLISEKNALTRGYLEVSVVNPGKHDVLSVNLSKCNLSIKDGTLMDATKYIGRITVGQTSFRLEFTWASKATRHPLQAFLRTLTYTFSGKEDHPTEKQIVISCTDKQTEPNMLTVTVKYKKSKETKQKKR
eukprot:TRINITY_DN6587_c0_g2_i1.p1 TRINITY_DN6587_c0_g2~~TRINITY_DN6587_c0_g2_i1.p1  ORF type:complete len:1835 (+),score=322.93 TRINITY_DN6587_c0_g2_i1:671-5506(+)